MTGTLGFLSMGCNEEGNDNFSLLLFFMGGPKRIFLSETQTNGNIGGISAADSICENDLNKPAGNSNWKALIADSTRSINTDWVLRANTTYTRVDGTEIGTTNADSTFDFPLTNSINDTGYYMWTGLRDSWNNSTANCSNWTSNSSGVDGEMRESDQLNWWVISDSPYPCDQFIRIICVEQ